MNSSFAVLHGFNGTIFAYGQTGTGKTHTMEGKPDDPGVIPRSFDHIFDHIARADQKQQYLVRASYLEIYQEEIRDLLSKPSANGEKKRLELKERPDTGVYVKDLSPFVCKSQSEIQHVMAVGNTNRTVGPTNMNEHSSRYKQRGSFFLDSYPDTFGPNQMYRAWIKIQPLGHQFNRCCGR